MCCDTANGFTQSIIRRANGCFWSFHPKQMSWWYLGWHYATYHRHRITAVIPTASQAHAQTLWLISDAANHEPWPPSDGLLTTCNNGIVFIAPCMLWSCHQIMPGRAGPQPSVGCCKVQRNEPFSARPKTLQSLSQEKKKDVLCCRIEPAPCSPVWGKKKEFPVVASHKHDSLCLKVQKNAFTSTRSP